MRSKLLLWSCYVTGPLSAAWVLLLALLVIRCKFSQQPFPVLAKFSPFRLHLDATDKLLQLFPLLALMAVVFLGLAWYRERRFCAIRHAAIAVGVSLLTSVYVVAFNPGGYVSWFLS